MFDYDLAIIGSGPAGFSAALQAARLGKRVLCVEKDNLGGTCLHWGCMPTKALLKSAEVYDTARKAAAYGVSVGNCEIDYAKMVERSRGVVSVLNRGLEQRFKKSGIEILRGLGRVSAPHTIAVTTTDQERHISAEHILVAVGCRPRLLPGIAIDGQQILTSKEALQLKTRPRSVIIVGGGAIGVEFAYLWGTLGSRVTLLEALPHLLPAGDADIAQTLTQSLSDRGVQVIANVQIGSLQKTATGVQLSLTSPEQKIIEADCLLIAIGVVPNTAGIIPETMALDEKGFIKVNERYQTNLEGIYAAGDSIGAPFLAHVGMFEGAQVVQGLFTQAQPKRVRHYPSCVYTQPQVASFGPFEKDLKGSSITVTKMPFSHCGKALTTGQTEGFIKCILEEPTKRLLGVHIVGAEATELIATHGLAIDLGADAGKLLQTIYAHPTLGELTPEVLSRII